MPLFASLLRGINVSGHKKIPMAGLKTLYEELGFTNVKTYIQSGNVVFETEQEDQVLIQQKIERTIEATYGFDVTVFIRTAAELQEVINSNPFETTEAVYVTFLAEKPSPERWTNLHSLDLGTEQLVLKNKDIFLQFPDGYGRAKLSNPFLESKLKVKATTRNWRTINEILNLF
ncbi:hypothetical protein BWI96_20280 [Siphonobacter sp. SORGH_AS_0500]|uniref:DUF1697 domain-containing protein n=1 Tax=Siphonobacter sp. SORGH_AS_0500 TaxID=1864824 RepID=UPI000CBA7AD4|nr:DUF1697 domain-containing protein [Siphonobacter sp. SORGH_AS_0500]PKK34792.1 hypothetical protein BWI96_20280 [Siphonobacter sp. SORGH_AS_0500]